MPNILLRTKRVVWTAIVVLMTTCALFAYSAITRYLAAVEAVDRAMVAEAAIEGTLSLAKDLETGYRGYILTGDEHFLEPYDAARAGMSRYLTELRRALGGQVEQEEHLRQLSRLVEAKLEFAARSVQLRRAGDVTGAVTFVTDGGGKAFMDQIRAECAAMTSIERATLRKGQNDARAARMVATWGVGFGSLLTTVIALLSLSTVHGDVRELQRSAAALRTSEEHFRLLAEHTTDLVRLLDASGRTTYVSPSVKALLGYEVDEFLSLPTMSLMHPDELATARSLLADISSEAKSEGVSTYRLRHKSGEYRFFEVRWSVQRNEGGAITLHTTGHDVTERVRAEETLARQAEQLLALSLRDELTKLYNRRGFLEVAGQAELQASRDGRPAALLFVDLNGMKRINDELGHDAGDDALVDTAAVLRAALHEGDVVARLGGDEFVAYALDFTPEQLDVFRRRLRELADAEVGRRPRSYRLSMSVGAAFSDASQRRPLEQLLDEADQEMYEQKRARRNAGDVSLVPPARKS